MATTAKELDKLAIKLVGDGGHYEKVLDKAVRDTEIAAKHITGTNKKQLAASKQAAARYNRELEKTRRVVEAVRTPAMRYKRELASINRLQRKGAIGAKTHRLALARLNREYQVGVHRIGKYASKVGGLGRRMAMTGGMMTLGLTLPILAVGGAMTKAAVDAVETKQKFDVVFSGVAKSAQKSADMLAKNYILSKEEAENLLSSTGDLMTGFGFTQKAALDLSTKVQILASDLASFANFEGGAARASEALTKALLGETEQAKALGIVIRQDNPEFKKLLDHFQKAEGMTLLQAKAMAVYTEALKQSKNAIGDVGRSMDSPANQLKRMAADIKDLSVDLGTLLIPMLKDMVAAVRFVVGWFGRLSTGWKKAILWGLGLLAAIGPLLLMFGLLATAVAAITKLIVLLSAVSLPIIIIVVKIAAAIALLVAGVAVLIWAFKTVIDFIWGPGSFSGALMGALATAKDWAMKVVGFVWNIGKNFKMLLMWLPLNWGNIMADLLVASITFIVNMAHNFKIVIFTMIRLFTLFQGFAIQMFRNVFDVNFGHWMEVGVAKAAKILFDFVDKAWEGIKSIFTGGGTKAQGLSDLAGALMGDLEKGLSSKDILKDAGRIVKQQAALLKTPLEGFKSSLTTLPKFALEIGKKTAKALEDADPNKKGDPKLPALDPLAAGKKGNKNQQFKVISLQRFSIDDASTSTAKKKQGVEDKTVAGKLDTLIEITRRGGGTGGGRVAVFGK